MGEVIDIKQLADILKVSTTTVSRVLNGKGEKYRISNETSKRIFEAAKKFNYSPNKIAKGLKTAKTDTIGLIIPDISNPFFSDIARSIETELRVRKYSMILCDSRDDEYVEKELITLLQSHKVEGIIIAPVGVYSDHLVDIYETGFPIVIIDRSFPNIKLPCITSDNFQGGFEAVNYLISLGHKKIACIQGIPQSQPSIERISGYRKAFEANGLKIDETLIIGDDYSIENGYRQTRILFSTNNPPTAIFALSNLISLGVIKAAKEIGLLIPDDLSIVSFDEQPYSEYLWTPMTTISQKKNEMGRLAIDILFKYIEKREFWEKGINIRLKTDIIYRNSVKRLS